MRYCRPRRYITKVKLNIMNNYWNLVKSENYISLKCLSSFIFVTYVYVFPISYWFASHVYRIFNVGVGQHSHVLVFLFLFLD